MSSGSAALYVTFPLIMNEYLFAPCRLMKIEKRTIANAQQSISAAGVAATMPYTGQSLKSMNISGISRMPFLKSARISDFPPRPVAWKKEI